MNVGLVEIRTIKNLDGSVAAKNFTFLFEGGTTATVGLDEKDFDRPEDEQKMIAAKKAAADVAQFDKTDERRTVNETMNL